MLRSCSARGTHCYLVRKEILPYLTFRMHAARHSPDEQLNELVLRNIAWYAFWPSLVAQDSERRTGPEFKACECYMSVHKFHIIAIAQIP
ncbi:MAG: hypothetical protein HY674_03430 [Chloroflexi bacterium]|nr:hypothetical protein [Chloroflexota bacterium]